MKLAWLVCAALAFGSSLRAAEPEAPGDLAAYMDSLGRMQERWQQAAQLLHDGRKAAAVELLGEFPYSGVPERWRADHQVVAENLESMKPGREAAGDFTLAGWYATAGAPALAIEAFEKDIQAGRSLSFHDRCSYALCLIEVRRFADARAALAEALKSADVASDWRHSVEIRLKALDGFADGQAPPLAFYRDFYTQYATSMDARRLSAYLAVWRMVQADPPSGEGVVLLATLFRNIGDGVAERLTLLWTATRLPATSPAAAEAKVALGNQDFDAGRAAEAVERWREVEQKHPNSSAWAKAVFNIGIALKRQARHREAIDQFGKILAANVNDREPGGSIMESYRNYRPRAQWEIAQCLFAAGDYQAALDAYLTAKEKYPLVSWCGNCQDAFERDYAFRQGLCRDWLGDTAGAIRDYYRATIRLSLAPPDPEVLSRILDLYEAAGKLDAWRRILDEVDRQFLARGEREARLSGRAFDAGKLKEYLPTQFARKVLAVRDLGTNKQWPQLVAMLRPTGSQGCPADPDTRRANWEAVEAARLLARDPAAAVPLLKASLSPQIDNSTRWVNYALGVCGTAEAVEILKAQVPDDYRERDVIAALSFAGELGEKAIADLDARGVARQYIEPYRKRSAPFYPTDVRFPPVPKGAKVPERLAELDEQVAYEESLPKSVTLDQSTPAATVRTMFQAMTIADTETFLKCTDGSRRWKGLAEDFARPSERRMNFEVGEPTVSGDSAEVPIRLSDAQHTESGWIILVRKEGRWIATDIKQPRRGTP